MRGRKRVLTDAEREWLTKAWANPEVTLGDVMRKLRVGDVKARALAAELDLGPKKTRTVEWPGERVEALKRLFADGYTQSQIARELAQKFSDPTITKNAVAGKLARLGVTYTVAQIKTRQSLASSAMRTRKPMPKGKGFVLPAMGGRTQAPPHELRAANIDATARARAVWQEPAVAPGRRTIATLQDGECSFPLGDPKSAEFTYCGNPIEGRHGYCERHRKAAFVPRPVVRRLDEKLGIPKMMGANP
jgi:GcrA cell cycle regulator